MPSVGLKRLHCSNSSTALFAHQNRNKEWPRRHSAPSICEGYRSPLRLTSSSMALSPTTEFFIERNEGYVKRMVRRKEQKVGPTDGRREYGVRLINFNQAVGPSDPDDTAPSIGRYCGWWDQTSSVYDFSPIPSPLEGVASIEKRASPTEESIATDDTSVDLWEKRLRQNGLRVAGGHSSGFKSGLRGSSLGIRPRAVEPYPTSTSSIAAEPDPGINTPSESMTHGWAANLGRSLNWLGSNVAMLILLATFCAVLALFFQTIKLQLDAWEILNREIIRKNERYYTAVDDDWRPDPRDIVRLMFSKNTSQTVMDTKILYHLQSLEERQNHYWRDLRQQQDESTIALHAMAMEIKNLHSSFSTLVDAQKLEKKLVQLNRDLKYFQEKVTRKDVPRVVVKTVRSPLTIITRTKVINKATKTQYVAPTDAGRHQVSKNPGHSSSPSLNEQDSILVAQKIIDSLRQMQIAQTGELIPLPSIWRTPKGMHNRFAGLLRNSKSMLWRLVAEDIGKMSISTSKNLQQGSGRKSSTFGPSLSQPATSEKFFTITTGFPDAAPTRYLVLLWGLVLVTRANSITCWIEGVASTSRGSSLTKLTRTLMMISTIALSLSYPAQVLIRFMGRHISVSKPAFLAKVKEFLSEALVPMVETGTTWIPVTTFVKNLHLPSIPNMRERMGILPLLWTGLTRTLGQFDFRRGVGLIFLVLKFAALLMMFLLITRVVPHFKSQISRGYNRLTMIGFQTRIIANQLLEFFKLDSKAKVTTARSMIKDYHRLYLVPIISGTKERATMVVISYLLTARMLLLGIRLPEINTLTVKFGLERIKNLSVFIFEIAAKLIAPIMGFVRHPFGMVASAISSLLGARESPPIVHDTGLDSHQSGEEDQA